MKGPVSENPSAVDVLTCAKNWLFYRKDIVVVLIFKKFLHAPSRLNETEQRKLIAKIRDKTKSITKAKRLFEQFHYRSCL